jgi:pimeloyl-ACP methyl ester carboxylesterase
VLAVLMFPPGCGHLPMSDDPGRVADLIIAAASRASAGRA